MAAQHQADKIGDGHDSRTDRARLPAQPARGEGQYRVFQVRGHDPGRKPLGRGQWIVELHEQIGRVQRHTGNIGPQPFDEIQELGGRHVGMILDRQTDAQLAECGPELLQHGPRRRELLRPWDIEPEAVMTIANVSAHITAAQCGGGLDLAVEVPYVLRGIDRAVLLPAASHQIGRHHADFHVEPQGPGSFLKGFEHVGVQTPMNGRRLGELHTFQSPLMRQGQNLLCGQAAMRDRGGAETDLHPGLHHWAAPHVFKVCFTFPSGAIRCKRIWYEDAVFSTQRAFHAVTQA